MHSAYVFSRILAVSIVLSTQATHLFSAASDPGYSDLGTGFDDAVHGVEVISFGKVWAGGSFRSLNGLPVRALACLTPSGGLELVTHLGGEPNGDVLVTARGNAGALLVGGAFTELGGRPQNRISQILHDGAPDPTFQWSGVFGGDPTTTRVLALTRDNADGSIWVGGQFDSINGTNQGSFLRILGNGSMDDRFQLGGTVRGSVRAIASLWDGGALLGGEFNEGANPGETFVASPALIRVKADGTLNTNWVSGLAPGSIVRTILQVGNEWLVGGQLRFTNNPGQTVWVARFNDNLEWDFTFAGPTLSWAVPPELESATLPAWVASLRLDQQGRVLMGGHFRLADGYLRGNLARYTLATSSSNAVMTLDKTFNPGLGFGDGDPASTTTEVSGTGELSDGRVMVFGHFTRHGVTPAGRLVRLLPDAVDIEIHLYRTDGTNPGPSDDQLVWTAGPGQQTVVESTTDFVTWTETALKGGGLLNAATLPYQPAVPFQFFRARSVP